MLRYPTALNVLEKCLLLLLSVSCTSHSHPLSVIAESSCVASALHSIVVDLCRQYHSFDDEFMDSQDLDQCYLDQLMDSDNSYTRLLTGMMRRQCEAEHQGEIADAKKIYQCVLAKIAREGDQIPPKASNSSQPLGCFKVLTSRPDPETTTGYIRVVEPITLTERLLGIVGSLFTAIPAYVQTFGNVWLIYSHHYRDRPLTQRDAPGQLSWPILDFFANGLNIGYFVERQGSDLQVLDVLPQACSMSGDVISVFLQMYMKSLTKSLQTSEDYLVDDVSYCEQSDLCSDAS